MLWRCLIMYMVDANETNLEVVAFDRKDLVSSMLAASFLSLRSLICISAKYELII